MIYDYFHLAIWIIAGIVITWGIFFAWVGYREVSTHHGKHALLAAYAANFSLFIGILWIIIWVSMVVVNIYQIIGDPSWHPALPLHS